MAHSGPSRERDMSPADRDDPERRVPPGQRVQEQLPVLHYGPVPKFRPDRWDFRVSGATASGVELAIDWADFQQLPTKAVVADFHCVTKFTVLDNAWLGVPTSVILREAPPAPDVTHVMVYAEYGYSTTMTLADFGAEQSLLATHRDGEPLTAEHGFPVRLVVPHLYAWKGPKWVRGVEYLTADRRGFWEDRGYHNRADPWTEQRYSYQEEPGDGPEL